MTTEYICHMDNSILDIIEPEMVKNFEIDTILGAVRNALQKQIETPYGKELKVIINKSTRKTINDIGMEHEYNVIKLDVTTYNLSHLSR